MRKLILMLVGTLIAGALAAGPALGQGDKAKTVSALGDLVSVDPGKGVLTIKTAKGDQATAAVSTETKFYRVQPGKTTLDGAQPIALADLHVGDRVFAQGLGTDASGAIVALRVLNMSAESIAQRNQRDQREWQSRGVMGEVKAVNPATNELTVESYRGDTVTVVVGPSADLRRMQRGAADLSNAERIKFSDIQVGNQVAVRGERSEDRTHITAEVVLAGTFARPVRGRVTSVDLAKNEVVVTSRDGRAVTVTLESGAMVRKLTPPAGPPPGARAEGDRAQADRQTQSGGGAAAAAPAAPNGPGGERRGMGGPGGGGFAFGLGDPSELERRTTPLELKDIAVGDIVFAVVEPGATETAARAKVLVKMEFPQNGQRRGPGMRDGGGGQGDTGGMEPPF